MADQPAQNRRQRTRTGIQPTVPARVVDQREDEDDDIEDSAERGLTAKKGRATPSLRQLETQEVERTGAAGLLDNFLEYLRGVRGEVMRTKWPTREELVRLTLIVVSTLVVSSLILGGISLGFTELFRFGLDNPLILLTVVAVAVVAGFIVYQRAQNRRPTGY